VNAVLPPSAFQEGLPPGASPIPLLRLGQPRQGPWHRLRRRLWHPLTAVCAVQAVLSLTLVWSNTAFEDEADYLWIGRLEWAHWLHGAAWPAHYADRFLSGLPAIYPPLGALANSAGGLAGARILSLGFMLGSTVLLYLTASRLIGSRGAIVAGAIWAVSEPVLRLAFATYDPLSVLFTALSAWLVVQAGYRRRGGLWVAAAAAALGLANATAYSGIVIDPVVIGFGFLVWLPRVRAAKALLWTAGLSAGGAAVFALMMAAAASWPGLTFTVINRSSSDHQSPLLVLNDVWGYSGLIISLAIVGAVLAVGAEGRQQRALIIFLGCAALVVPAAQLRDQSGWSLDKHLAYGIWFAAIAAGYAVSKLIGWLPESTLRFTAACCVVALSYPAISSWESAWQVYHSWANAESFILNLRPVATRSRGVIYTAAQDHVAEYYLPQVNWSRWNTGLSLDPVSVAPAKREQYYANQLRQGNYGTIALFYSTTFSSAPELKATLLLPASGLLPRAGSAAPTLLSRVGEGPGEPGLSALTQALLRDHSYQRAAIGPFDAVHDHGIYVIWQKKART
jgi:hypothetical protein